MTLNELISDLDYIVNKSQLATLEFDDEDAKQLLHWLEDYKELKAHFESLPDWIPVFVRCDEALPKKDGEYLCVSNGEFKILPYRNGEFYCTCFDAVLRCCNSSVTHWMSLPSKEELNET